MNDYTPKKTIKTEPEIQEYLSKLEIPKLTDMNEKRCEGLLPIEECHSVLKKFQPNKAPGNDGILVEFYQQFWPLFGKLMVDSFDESYLNGELTTSQRQAVIPLLDKGKDRTLLKNWRPISLKIKDTELKLLHYADYKNG